MTTDATALQRPTRLSGMQINGITKLFTELILGGESGCWVCCLNPGEHF